MKYSKLQIYMQTAETFAQQSPDSNTKVGSILVHKNSGAVMGMAFNGFSRDAADHLLPTSGDDKYPYFIHSETNLLYSACRHGVNTSDCFVICTLSPCINCCRSMHQAGIDTIYFRDIYKDFQKGLDMKDLIITLTKVGEYTKMNVKGSKK